MDRAAARRTPLTEVSVEGVGGGAEGKYKVLTGCRYVSVDRMRCGWYEREKGGWLDRHEPMPSDVSEDSNFLR